jgi:hypothetical protein
MKLATITTGLARITAKIRGMKLNAVRVLAAATLAGAVLVAAAPAAQAQRVVVRFGGPRVFYAGPRVVVAPPVAVYGAPYTAGPVYGSVGFYGRGRWDHDRGGWGRGRR